MLTIRYGLMDAGYDYVPIYQQLLNMEAHGIVAYNKRNEGEMIGFDEHFAPTCVREHSYRYESYNEKYQSLKFKKAFICGYSTGGSIVLEYLLNSADWAIGGIIIGGMSEVRDKYLKGKISLGMSLASKGAVPVLALSISWSNSNTQELFIKMFKEARKGDARNIEQYYRYSLHYNYTHQLEKIDLPILLVYGKKDKPFYYYAKLLHEKLPCKELKFIDHAKHQIPTKAANDLNEMIKHFIYTHDEYR